MAFPSTPTNGQIAVVGGIAYQYATTPNSWSRILSSANVITANSISANFVSANTFNINNAFTAPSISTTGNVTGNYILGNGSQLTGIATGSISNITSGTSNITIASSGGNAAVNIGGTANVAVFAASGEYVTGVVSATGNITGGNLITGGLISATGVLSVTGATTLTTLSTGNISAGNVYSGGSITTGSLISAVGNVTAASGLFTNIVNVASFTGSVASVTGNVTGGNILFGSGVVSGTGNITGGNLNSTGLSLSGNVVSVLTSAANITTTANISGGNIIGIFVGNVTGTTVSVTGNITGGNLNAAGLSLTSNVISAINSTANITTTANISGGNIIGIFVGNVTGTTVSVLGNITGGNLNATGLSVSGNIVSAINSTANITTTANISGGNILGGANVNATSLTGTTVSVLGNITGGNVNTNTIVGTATTIRSTGALNFSATGNIVVNSTYINGVLDPVQNQDVATKAYVDSVAQGLHVHQAANLATTADLATYTGATVTYNNGASGVGATLSLTGNTLTTLDGTAIPGATSTRLLIKNQGNAVQNGVYNYTSSSLLTRSAGEDTNGELNGGDFLFVMSGATLADTGWVQSTDNVVIGTSAVVFTQFSGAGTYTANTSAGLVLDGTVFSAKTDNISTAFDGSGNIVVKAGAQLTTPNIGAATGTSLSVTGNITGGNIIGIVAAGSNTITTSGNITGGNIIGIVAAGSNTITTSGNITGGNVLFGSGVVSGTGNITGGNINAAGLSLTSNVVSALNSTANITTTANISGGNILFGSGAVSGTGNITGGNILGGANVNATTHTGTTVSVTGNITGGNVNAAGLSLTSNVVSALNVTGNIAGGNITTPGLISVSGNITAGNILGGANVNAVTHTGSTVSVTGNIITGGGIVSRVVPITDATSVTINADTTDLATQTNTQVTGTLTVNAPTGTLANGQKLTFRLQSSNVQTFSWNAVFAGSTDLSLPTTSSGSSKYDYMGFIYNSTATKWQLLAKNFGF